MNLNFMVYLEHSVSLLKTNRIVLYFKHRNSYEELLGEHFEEWNFNLF